VTSYQGQWINGVSAGGCRKKSTENIDVDFEGRLFIPHLSFVKVRDILLKESLRILVLNAFYFF
jgi:hypothetical protein